MKHRYLFACARVALHCVILLDRLICNSSLLAAQMRLAARSQLVGSPRGVSVCVYVSRVLSIINSHSCVTYKLGVVECLSDTRGQI